MENRIVEFANLLRGNGIRVSVSEGMDALQALGLLGIEDPSRFRDALRTTLVKRSADHPPFENLFDLFFLGLSASVRASEANWLETMRLSPTEFQKLLDLIQDLLDHRDEEISPLTRALLSGDLGQVERIFYAMDRAEGELSREGASGLVYSTLAARLGMDRVRRDIEAFKSAAARAGIDGEVLEQISRYVDWRLQEISELLGEFLRRESRKNETLKNPERPEHLLEKSFVTYTEEDVRKMQDAVIRLARRFKNLLSLRRKWARRGRFDVKETLRRNLQYGGVPFQIRLERKRREKPQIVLLCDISDSVLNASRFMLHFVYSVQELYHKVRSFVFVSDIGEVTRLFEENDLRLAVDKALKGEVIDVFAHSNFGRAFELFYRSHLSVVTPKTTVIVMGDGRNNYHLPNDWVLREIRGKAKQLIWLNPESRLTWGYGDSEMPRYIPHCDRVEECRSIRQLYTAMDRIAP